MSHLPSYSSSCFFLLWSSLLFRASSYWECSLQSTHNAWSYGFIHLDLSSKFFNVIVFQRLIVLFYIRQNQVHQLYVLKPASSMEWLVPSERSLDWLWDLLLWLSWVLILRGGWALTLVFLWTKVSSLSSGSMLLRFSSPRTSGTSFHNVNPIHW